MNALSMVIGLILGIAFSYLIFKLIHKAKYVSKVEFDETNNRLNQLNTDLRVSEDRSQNQKHEYLDLQTKHETVLSEQMKQQATVSSLETLLSTKENRLAEQTTELQKQIQLNEKHQHDVNLTLQQLAEARIQIESYQENLTSIKGELAKHKEIIENLTEENKTLTAESSKLSANNSALEDKLKTQKQEITELQENSRLQFEQIANKILEEKTGKFTETNKTNIEALLKPLGENIDLFKKKVEETYDKESKQRFSLEEKVKELVEQTNKVSSEANNLANALKGQVKKQGNWGEMILESILQQSGLVKNREYFLQQTIQDENGKNLRPDVLVKLPDERVIIIDSKVSLVAYDRFSSAETTEEQSTHINDHIKSIYNHIDDLHAKKYDNLDTSLDFTMMFIPIEPAYLTAIQNDQNMWAYAYSKRILLISPTNLIACLKLMADLWKREMQSKNAMEIVRRGELMYEKFVGFVSTLEDVGKHIDKAQYSYSTALGQLNTGSGNLVGQAMKLKNLGLKSNKEISSSFLPSGLETDDDFDALQTKL